MLKIPLAITTKFSNFYWFFILQIFSLLLKLSIAPSAELEDLQQLCPSVQGVFCSHCSHKSVEQICPLECGFCAGGGGGNGIGSGSAAIPALSAASTDDGNFIPGAAAPLFGGIGAIGGGFPLQQRAALQNPFATSFSGAAQGLAAILPQNLATLKRQCSLVSGAYCTICRASSISELCVNECLQCENGGGGPLIQAPDTNSNLVDGDGTDLLEAYGDGTGEGIEGEADGDDEDLFVEQPIGGGRIGDKLPAVKGNGPSANNGPLGLFEIFRQLQKMEKDEQTAKRGMNNVDDDVGAEEMVESNFLENNEAGEFMADQKTPAEFLANIDDAMREME